VCRISASLQGSPRLLALCWPGTCSQAGPFSTLCGQDPLSKNQAVGQGPCHSTRADKADHTPHHRTLSQAPVHTLTHIKLWGKVPCHSPDAYQAVGKVPCHNTRLLKADHTHHYEFMYSRTTLLVGTEYKSTQVVARKRGLLQLNRF
jgi:hypothetical protein